MGKVITSSILIKALIVFILLIFLAVYSDKNYLHNSIYGWFLYLVPTIALIINVLGFYLNQKLLKQHNIGNVITILFGVKLFSYLTLTVIFFLLETSKQLRVIFILFLFIVYTLNSILLIVEMIRLNRKSDSV